MAAVEVVVEGHLMAACGLWTKTNMVGVEEEVEEEAGCLFWLSEREQVLALMEAVWLQVEEEFGMGGHVMRRKYRLSVWPGSG